jgi:uncharacterized protein YoxC
MFNEEERSIEQDVAPKSLFIALEVGDQSQSVTQISTPLERRFSRQNVTSGVEYDEQKKTVVISAEALAAFMQRVKGGEKFDDNNDAVQVISLIKSHLAARGNEFSTL